MKKSVIGTKENPKPVFVSGVILKANNLKDGEVFSLGNCDIPDFLKYDFFVIKELKSTHGGKK